MKQTFVMAAGMLALAGCMATDTAEPAMTAFYDCGDGTRLRVESLSGDRVQVRMNDGEPIILPAVRAASGAKYMTARHEFWSRGDEAMWTVGRMATQTCQKVAEPQA